jgi:phosphomannomutase
VKIPLPDEGRHISHSIGEKEETGVDRTFRVDDLMSESGVTFGTSGARGLTAQMTDMVCYVYTVAFIQYLEQTGEAKGAGKIAVGGDLRSGTERIMMAAAKAVTDKGYGVDWCGRLPSPALANYGLIRGIPTVMVTGSHIPEDRNGIKYTKKDGEILKQDELGIKQETVTLKRDLFDQTGMFSVSPAPVSPTSKASEDYINRYRNFFPNDCLKGKRVGVYQHSAVGREHMVTILSSLGALVTPLGHSSVFVPVDTEAIRPEDVEKAKKWSAEHHFDAIVSTDGDSDRPLISDENGKWLRGDVAGILCARYLGADAVATPVSCNTAVEKCGFFPKVYRTRIGSPYVIEAMQQARAEGAERVVGYEANGGFLTASPIVQNGKTLDSLPTRDALIVHIAILLLSVEKEKTISQLLTQLPQRFTHSGRLKAFATAKSRGKIQELAFGIGSNDYGAIDRVFEPHFGKSVLVDMTDGLRITFKNGEIVHLRPSGNAPEFRCYNEADTEPRAREMNRVCMNIMSGWR